MQGTFFLLPIAVAMAELVVEFQLQCSKNVYRISLKKYLPLNNVSP